MIEKSIRHARVRARHIVIRGDVTGGELQSDLGVEIQGDLRDSTVGLGYRTGEIQNLKRQRIEMQAADKELAGLDVRVGAGARKFIRDYPQVDLRLGSILTPSPRELKVDLKAFYDALGGQVQEDTGKRLQKFYLRVVVGMITKSNKAYISQNTSRRKIFLKVIEELREHLMLVLRADTIRMGLERLQSERNELLGGLGLAIPLRYRARGLVGEGCRIRALHLSGIQDSQSGQIEMDETWAEIKVLSSDLGPQLESWSLQGKKTLFKLGALPKNGSFELIDGSVVWKAVPLKND